MSSLTDVMEHLMFKKMLRTYMLNKSDKFFNYGITLHTEKTTPTLDSHLLVYPRIEIELNSPSHLAGMRDGQRIVAVSFGINNGKFVNEYFKTIESIVEALEYGSNNEKFITIKVIDPELWKEFMENPSCITNFSQTELPPKSNKIVYFIDF